MSTPEQLNKPADRKEPTPMRVYVKGRIEQSRLFDGSRFTRIITPAPDAYSRPQVIEIKSKQRLGEKGDEIAVVCALGGYQRKPYQVTDKETGERVTLVPVDHTLEAVEQS
ncbi:single-stranded DNA-binding protein [Undibacterium sp. Rencai35W]|uniref:single-stranded DNA-binding protein n=1 Tax=Undibacterium sp. Rencai35W TaxID=3413046 RepID=UPI003BF32462